MLSLYNRAKNEDGKWRYKRMKTGRGIKTGDIAAPFYVRRSRDGKQIWHGLHARTMNEAKREASALEAGLAAQSEGLQVGGLGGGGVTLHAAIEHAKKSKKRRTANGYRLNLRQFEESTSVKYLQAVTRDVIRDFRDWLDGQGYDPRTQHNRVLTVLSLLKECKISTGFSLTRDLPTFEDETPVPFAEEELRKLFVAMTREEQGPI